jgi:hypothetical protein
VPALEPLISTVRGSRAPVAPVYLERTSRPLVGIRTLRGSVLFEPGARAPRGSSLLGKGPGHLMPADAATVRDGNGNPRPVNPIRVRVWAKFRPTGLLMDNFLTHRVKRVRVRSPLPHTRYPVGPPSRVYNRSKP